jgi:hypothetical protein
MGFQEDILSDKQEYHGGRGPGKDEKRDRRAQPPVLHKDPI